MKWGRGLALVLALALLLATGACASGGRLGRMSPLVNDAAPNRVSLWPLVYHSGKGTAVLWPVFDVDDKGFALRPLVAKDGPRWEVLYPWAVHDTSTGKGWALPFYWFAANAGLFPIANFGKFSYVGPFWWRRDSGGTLRSGGLFPVALLGDTSYVGPVWWGESSGGLFPLVRFGATSYVGPVWWRGGSGGLFPLVRFGGTSYVGPVWWSEESGGLFPLMRFGATSYVGPAWWDREDGSFGLFPLFGTGDLRHVGPVWWKRGAGGRYTAGVFPLLWFDATARHFALWPLYGHDREADARSWSALFWLAHSAEDAAGSTRWALPFYYSREQGGKSDTVLFPFFWKRTRGDHAHVYTLLGDRRVDPASRSFNLYPLWWSNESADSSWRMLLPVFYYGTEGDERTVLTPLGGRRWSRSGAVRYFNVLGPLFHRSRSADGNSERTAVLWPLFERRRVGDAVTTRAAPFWSSTTTPRGSEGWYAAGLGRFQDTAAGSSHRLWPFYSVTEEERRPDVLYDLTLYGSREHGGRTARRLFPLFWSRHSAAGADTSFLLGLGNYSRVGEGTSWRLWPFYSATEEERRPDVLYDLTLYGSREHGGTTARRLFPLFWSEHSAAGADTSFLLGLGNYSRVGEATSWRLWPLVAHSEREEDSAFLHWTTLFGSRAWPGHASRHVGGPFVYASTTDDERGERAVRRRWLTLFTDERDEALGVLVPDDLGAQRQNRVRRSEQGFLFGSFVREHHEYRVWREGAVSDEEARVLSRFSTRFDGAPNLPRDEERARAVLATRGLPAEGASGADLQRAVARFADAATETVAHDHVRVPLVFDYEDDGWRTAWSGPLWLVSSLEEPGRSKFSVLYYAWRSETEGDETRRDIFPFITWDDSPRAVEVSFLWRLFRYRRDAEGRSGHFLFIPW